MVNIIHPHAHKHFIRFTRGSSCFSVKFFFLFFIPNLMEIEAGTANNIPTKQIIEHTY